MTAVREAGDALHQLIEQITMVVVRTLPPGGLSEKQALSELMMLVDGPLRRLVVREWEKERVSL